MLKNYYAVNEETKISTFLKELKDKKNSHYIILDTEPTHFVDIRQIALKAKNASEKLKSYKKRLSFCEDETPEERLKHLIKTGDRVIETKDGLFDFIDGLKIILENKYELLDKNAEYIKKEEIYALNENDKISQARNLFLNKKINLLPVIKGLKIIGELRPIDLLVGELFSNFTEKGNFWDEKNKENILNLPIINLMNPKPLTKDRKTKISEIIELMINKGLPSIIIVEKQEKLFSVISYKDIFKLYEKETSKEDIKYTIEYVGTDILYEDEFATIKTFAERKMNKLHKIGRYDSLKIRFKHIGEKDSGHKRKVEIKFLLSKGNQIITVEKELTEGGSYNEETKTQNKRNWNIPQIVQEGLEALENRIKN